MDLPPELIHHIAFYLLNYYDQLNFRLVSNDLNRVLMDDFPKYEGSHGKCIICGKKPRCTKRSKVKQQFITNVLRSHQYGRGRGRGRGLRYQDGRMQLDIEGVPAISYKKYWRKFLPCGCIYHPYCKDIAMLKEHTKNCQKNTRFCTVCGIPLNKCKHQKAPLRRLPWCYASDINPISDCEWYL